MNEQQTLKLLYGDDENIIKICDLKRSDKPLITNVKIDEFTKKASENFDYDFTGENKFFPIEITKEIENLDFQILCIVGASGSGKSVLSKYFMRGEQTSIEWNNEISIMSNFENPNDAIEKLIAVGLNSIPTWCKPRNVLSIGEGFRVDTARQIKDNCVIDEFTSTVDRNVALGLSYSLQKYIRSKGLKRCVFVSCHKDFIDMLLPDYVIDLDDMCLYDTRGLPKRKIEIQLYETPFKKEMWNTFKQHHYLSQELNLASRCFVAYFNNDLVGFIAMLPLPNGYLRNAFRIHRLVVLPDYQGMGIASKIIEEITKYYEENNNTIYIRTSHIKLKEYFDKRNDWKETNRSGTVCPTMPGEISWNIIQNRIAYSYKHINELLQNKHYKPKDKQMSIFEIIDS